MADYLKLGFKSGLEIHQQIDAPKLFSGAPSFLRSDEPHYIIKRKLHAVAGEGGEVDVAARHEASQEKEFYYEGYNDTISLVELDESPPRVINEEALDICLQIALLLNCEIYAVSQVMRKTVIDGSNTSGFQRTTLIAHDGWVITKTGRVGIQSICLEEDAARIIERKKIINGYSAYQRYNELLQLSHQIALTTDLNSLIHTSMQAISHYFKAESSVFIKYKRNIKKKYSVLGKINISENLINEVVSSFFKKNTIDEHSCTLTIEKNLVCIPITQTGFSYFLFLINPIVIEDYSHSQVGQNGHFYTEIEFLQKQTSLALKNILKINDAKTLALTDDLTGLRNQRYLESHLEYELKLAKKHKKPLSLLFIDIDKFKCVNDQHGHLIGSKILRELAEVMKRSVRDPEKDKIIRYGGDEYVIILSNLDSEGAYKVAERLRKKVEGYIFLKADKKISVTISIGISNYPETSFTKEEILNLADKALYAAKKLSRNAVYSASKMNL